MRKVPKAILLIALVSPMLGGCNSFVGKALGLNKRESPALAQRSAKDYAQSQMELGKEGLDTGQYALAITAFRNARIFPETAAGALNGLAISYLQLGRPDLAERFFKAAVAEDPADKRYQANLNRFYAEIPAVAVRTVREETQGLASQDAVTPALAASNPVRALASLGSATLSAQSATGNLTRISASEVSIRTAKPVPVMTADGRRRAAGAVAAVAKPVRRANPGYPVRFGIADAATIPTQSAAAPYPVRLGMAGQGPATPQQTSAKVIINRSAGQ